MAKKINPSTPQGTPKNNLGRVSEGEVKGQVPRMRNPPPPPTKNDK